MNKQNVEEVKKLKGLLNESRWYGHVIILSPEKIKESLSVKRPEVKRVWEGILRLPCDTLGSPANGYASSKREKIIYYIFSLLKMSVKVLLWSGVFPETEQEIFTLSNRPRIREISWPIRSGWQEKKKKKKKKKKKEESLGKRKCKVLDFFFVYLVLL